MKSCGLWYPPSEDGHSDSKTARGAQQAIQIALFSVVQLEEMLLITKDSRILRDNQEKSVEVPFGGSQIYIRIPEWPSIG